MKYDNLNRTSPPEIMCVTWVQAAWHVPGLLLRNLLKGYYTDYLGSRVQGWGDYKESAPPLFTVYPC